MVKSLNNKVFPGAKVKLYSLKSGIILDAVSDSLGRFSFDNLVLTDSIKLTVQATTVKNSNKLEVVLDTLTKMGMRKRKLRAADSVAFLSTMKEYVANLKKQDELLVKMGGMSRTQRLMEVNISAKKRAGQQYSAQGMFKVPEGSADQTFMFKNPGGCASLGLCLQGMLQGVVFQSSEEVQHYPFTRNKAMDVYLDGRKLQPQEIGDIFDNNQIDPSDIGKIEIVRTNMAMINMLGGNPSLMIITKAGYVKRSYNPNVVNLSPKGYNKVRDFYSPKYDGPGNAAAIPDLRSTIYWNANVKTDATGKTTLNYFNGDGPGNYKVVVEGINAAGELGRQVFRYKVEAGAQAQLTEFAKIETNLAKLKLDTLGIKLPVERTYMHLDKTSYNVGDTLYFKGYVFSGPGLAATKTSGVLMVELNNDSAEVVRRVSVPIKNGVAMAQIVLPGKVFKEGGYTLRAYTNWMQNYGDGHFFSQRFYLGVARADRWLVKSTAEIDSTANGDELKVNLNLMRLDKSPVALRDVLVQLFEGDNFLYSEKLQTGSDGALNFTRALKRRANGRNIRVEIRSLHPADKNQILQVPLIIHRVQKIDLQFMPEGGKLVAGLRSVIGFKAIAEDGKGMFVEGNILDKAEKVVGSFSAVHNGMGSFEFTPLEGESYSAKITSPAGAIKPYNLPKAAKEGIALTIQNLEGSSFVTLKLATTAKGFIADSTYYLIGTTRGKVYYSAKMKQEDQTLNIPKATFPTGMTHFTLLKGTQPVNERVIFINHHEKLDITLAASKPSYGKREPVELAILVKDRTGAPVKGSFSMAVTDNSQVRADSVGNNGIDVSLLLNSNLTGTIESPSYYLGTGKNVTADLDNLMLTQGWTDYDWKMVFNFPKKIPFGAEDGNKITGFVRSLLDKPVAKAQVLISSQKPSFLVTTFTDSLGRYTFKDFPKIDTGSFFIQARTPKGKIMTTGEVTVDRFQAPKLPRGFPEVVMPWYVNSDSTQLRNFANRVAKNAAEDGFAGEGLQLDEVSIKATKIIAGSLNPYGPGKSDLAFDAADIKESGTANLYQLLKQKVPGFKVIYDYENSKGAPTIRIGKYVVSSGDINIDGRPLQLRVDHDWLVDDLKDGLGEYTLANIKGIEVIYSRKFTVQTVDNSPGYRDYNFAKIEITTLNGKGWYVPVHNDVVYYRPLPGVTQKQFYSPKYTVNSPKGQDDYRSTIFWEPNIITDANGKATVSFYTSDSTGAYTISFEGTDMKGGLGSARKGIVVNK
ncbi:hypothetical protein ACVWYN_003347 [Pedobacter sp. UYP24]